MIICHYLMIIWSHYLTYLIRKRNTHPIWPGYVVSKCPWPGLHAQKRWSRICWIHRCKVTPAPPDAGGDNHTNASSRTRHYSFCIWNSGIARSAGFAFDFFDGALAASAMATDQFEQDWDVSHSVSEHDRLLYKQQKQELQSYCRFRSLVTSNRRNQLL